MDKNLSRRDALKILAAATGGIALSTLPVWKRPLVGVGALPAFAQTSLGTGDFQATLTWDKGNRTGIPGYPHIYQPGEVDLDLYVSEPGQEKPIFYDHPNGVSAVLDSDNMWGLGPENIFVAPGNAMTGAYQVWITYYYGDVATTATITIRVFANTAHEQSRTFTRQLSGPGDQGACQIKVAEVTFPAGTIVEVTGNSCQAVKGFSKSD
jgi:hypothetical protein